jgi:ligand-binding sensor domain-containing protein/signal transduction histidine kinase
MARARPGASAPKGFQMTGVRRPVQFMHLTLWLATLGVLAFPARGANFVTRVWLRENGLPQNTVTALLQARDGYLWIGTYDGLARFDGMRFVCYDSANTPEMADSRVTSLFEDKDGSLWIGHETGELTVRAQGKFHAVSLKIRWPKKKIIGIGADEKGDVWLLSNDGLLARVKDGLVLTPEAGMVSDVVEMTESAQGDIWVARAGRVSRLRNGRIIPLEFSEGLTNHTVTAIAASRDGGVWMTVNRHLRKWREGAWAEDRGPSPFEAAPLLQLLEGRAGELLGATSDHGFAIVSPQGEVSSYNRASGFCSDWVTALCEDREGNFWAGTGGGGLAMLRESNVRTVSPPDGWQARPVLSVVCDESNAMWAGTEGAGLYRLKDGVWTNFSVTAGLVNPYIWSLAEDTGGRLYAGSWGAGLFEQEGNAFATPAGLAGILTPMPALCAARAGGLWIGTGDGLLRYDAEGKTTWYGRDDGAVKRDIRCVLESRAGDVWFGTAGEGLFRLQAGGLRQFRKADGLPGNFVNCLREDGDGSIWIGTSDGLCRFKDGQFATIGMRQGLPDNVICDIEDDGLGSLWMSSYNGIFRVSKAELEPPGGGPVTAVRCQALGIAEGLPTLEATSGGCRTKNGELWFSTGRGLVVIDPPAQKINRRPPPVLIEALLVDNQLVGEPAPPEGVKIPPGRHRVAFQYAGLSFTAPEKVRFKHRLDGLDADWVDAAAERTTEYPYIPPGYYTFRVLACNNDGVWNETGATLAFTVLPHFWQTVWFSVAGVTGLASLAGAGAWYGTRRRMRRKVEFLERQRAVERERTRIAKDIHDDLGASLTRINLLSQSARREMADPPQTAKNLDQICVTARQLTRAMDEIVWAVDPQHDTLDSLATYLGKLIHELMSDSGIRCRLDFPMQLPPWAVTAEVRHNLFLAFKEALHNVLKHSGASEVRIRFTLEAGGLVINITDNGRGFDPAAAGAAARPRRNGLVNMRQRLDEIGGRCEITGEPGGGTRVTFVLPATS